MGIEVLKKNVLYIILIYITFIIINFGCGDNTVNKIYGKWEMYMSEEILANGKIKKEKCPPGRIIEFFSDKTVMTPIAGMGTWSILNDGRIKIYFGGAHIMLGSFKGDHLTLIIEEGNNRGNLYFKKKNDTRQSFGKGEKANQLEGPGIDRQPAKMPRPQPAQPPVLQPQPQPQPQVEPKTATGSFSLDEEAPPSAPAQPTYSPSAPRPAPPPQAAWGGRWPWTSERLIQPNDLWPLSLLDLELMRNEIYARHGWVFNRRDLRAYFARQPWYSPKGNLSNREQANRWVQAELTPLEKKNIQIIVSQERALKR